MNIEFKFSPTEEDGKTANEKMGRLLIAMGQTLISNLEEGLQDPYTSVAGTTTPQPSPAPAATPAPAAAPAPAVTPPPVQTAPPVAATPPPAVVPDPTPAAAPAATTGLTAIPTPEQFRILIKQKAIVEGKRDGVGAILKSYGVDAAPKLADADKIPAYEAINAL